MSQKPVNLLLAIADDASHFGVYGHGFVKTPHIDQFAREGLCFHNAFTTNPKCAPSRASLLTGRHFWQNREASQHWNYWPENLPVYTDYIGQAGYHVGYTGKGWGPGGLEKCERTDNPAGPVYNEHELVPPKDSLISSNDYAENFRQFLSERKTGQPFCFWYGGHEPHRAYRPGEGLKHGKSLDELNACDVPPYWPNEKVVKEDVLDYAFEVEWFDKQLGRIRTVLEESGEMDNTLVIITSDNGMPFPRVKGNMYEDDFRLPFIAWWKGKILPGSETRDLISFIDIAPTFMEAAGLEIPEAMTGTSLFDIFENRAEKKERTQVVMGRERHDLGREGDLGYPVRVLRNEQYLYIRNLTPERWPAGNPETGYTGCDSSPTKDRILNLKDEGDERFWKLCFDKRPLEELYDISHDPHCMNNIADQERAVCEKMWNDLEKTLFETEDPRILGRGDWFEQVEYIGKAEHSWENYLKGTWKPQDY